MKVTEIKYKYELIMSCVGFDDFYLKLIIVRYKYN